MSTDRELLELAAKASGYASLVPMPISRDEFTYFVEVTDGGSLKPFNPLTDDGDALRLANKLRLYIGHTMFGCPDAPGTALVGVDPWRQGSAPLAYERFSGPSDQDAATRRAIVRAAAEIGRELP